MSEPVPPPSSEPHGGREVDDGGARTGARRAPSPNPHVGAVVVKDGASSSDGPSRARRRGPRRGRARSQAGRRARRKGATPLRDARAVQPRRAHAAVHRRHHRGQGRARRHRLPRPEPARRRRRHREAPRGGDRRRRRRARGRGQAGSSRPGRSSSRAVSRTCRSSWRSRSTDASRRARGASKWVTGPEARARVHALRGAPRRRRDRHRHGARRRPAPHRPRRSRAEPARASSSTPSSASPPTPASSRPRRTCPRWVLCSADAPALERGGARRRGAWRSCARRAPPRGGSTPQAALRLLAARGVVTLMVEGGAELAGSILAGRLADELHAFVAPILLGPRGRPGAVDWAGPDTPAEAPRIARPTGSSAGPTVTSGGPSSTRARNDHCHPERSEGFPTSTALFHRGILRRRSG